MIRALFDAALGYRVRNTTYWKAAELSEDVAGQDLKALARESPLVSPEERRGRHYVAAEPLRGLRARIRDGREVEDPFEPRRPMPPGSGPLPRTRPIEPTKPLVPGASSAPSGSAPHADEVDFVAAERAGGERHLLTTGASNAA